LYEIIWVFLQIPNTTEMMKRILTLLIVFLPVFVMAQESEGFTADRPGATTGVDVLPKGRVQWETGVGWERNKIDFPETTWTVNTSLLRWGISSNAELRLQADWLYSSADGEHSSGLSNLAIGTKVHLFEGWKAVPAVSLLANVMIPGGSDADFLPKEWGGQMGILFENQLTPWLSLGYEADLIWSDDSRPTLFYGACLCFDFSDRLFLALEEYNYNTSEGTNSWSEVSLGYMLSSRVQIDIGADISLNHPGSFKNLMLGVAWQINN